MSRCDKHVRPPRDRPISAGVSEQALLRAGECQARPLSLWQRYGNAPFPAIAMVQNLSAWASCQQTLAASIDKNIRL
jgi:hypothetical protein